MKQCFLLLSLRLTINSIVLWKCLPCVTRYTQSVSYFGANKNNKSSASTHSFCGTSFSWRTVAATYIHTLIWTELRHWALVKSRKQLTPVAIGLHHSSKINPNSRLRRRFRKRGSRKNMEQVVPVPKKEQVIERATHL